MIGMRMGMGLGAPMQVSGEIPESTINVEAVLDGATLEPAVSGDYYVWTFDTPVAGTSSSGTFTTDAELEIEALIIGGGGSGGGRKGGGGGAGGFLELVGENAFNIAAGEYAIAIGKGGARTSSAGNGNNGDQSSFDKDGTYDLYANGGGGGGNFSGDNNGQDGGSGGGGSGAATTGAAGTAIPGSTGALGNNGNTTAAGQLYSAGGGGSATAGAGGGGSGASPTGEGGNGTQSSITGEPVFYSAGGGGGNASASGYQSAAGEGNDGGKGGTKTTQSGGNGLPENRGHGGGGGGDDTAYRYGGKGSDGVVIIRCLKAGVTPATAPARASYGGGDTFIFEADNYLEYR